jgi:hypothetical protein
MCADDAELPVSEARGKQRKGVEIQVNSDKNALVDSQEVRGIGAEVNRVLKRFAGRLTRVEVHLRDVNSHKFGTNDKRCLIEARPARHRPLIVSSGAATVREAVRGTLEKLRSSLQTLFGRLGRLHEDTTEQGRPRTRVRCSLTTEDAPSERATTEGVGRAKPRATKRPSVAARMSASNKTFVHSRDPKKKGIYQARRKSWPAR